MREEAAKARLGDERAVKRAECEAKSSFDEGDASSSALATRFLGRAVRLPFPTLHVESPTT
jgi:hypothetical protein